MLRVLSDVRLPNVLQIMVVVHCSSPLNFGDDPASIGKTKEEVWSYLRQESSLRSKHDLLAETHFAQHLPDQSLNLSTLGVVYVGCIDSREITFQVGAQPTGILVNDSEFSQLCASEFGANKSRVLNSHLASFSRGKA